MPHVFPQAFYEVKRLLSNPDGRLPSSKGSRRGTLLVWKAGILAIIRPAHGFQRRRIVYKIIFVLLSIKIWFWKLVKAELLLMVLCFLRKRG